MNPDPNFESSVLEDAKFVVGRLVFVEFLNGASKVNGKHVAIQLKSLICSANTYSLKMRLKRTRKGHGDSSKNSKIKMTWI